MNDVREVALTDIFNRIEHECWTLLDGDFIEWCYLAAWYQFVMNGKEKSDIMANFMSIDDDCAMVNIMITLPSISSLTNEKGSNGSCKSFEIMLVR